MIIIFYVQQRFTKFYDNHGPLAAKPFAFVELPAWDAHGLTFFLIDFTPNPKATANDFVD